MDVSAGYLQHLIDCDIGETLAKTADPRAVALDLYSEIQEVIVDLRNRLMTSDVSGGALAGDCEAALAALDDKLFALRSQIFQQQRQARWREAAEPNPDRAWLADLRANMQERQRMAAWFRDMG